MVETREKNSPLTSSSIEYTDTTISAIVDLIPPQGGVAVRLDPHSCHCIVKDLIVLNEAQACKKDSHFIMATADEKSTHQIGLGAF